MSSYNAPESLPRQIVDCPPDPPWQNGFDMPAYALTIFTGAFLLFQVQPVIGKYILPWFGGGPGVWTTCMLFFQVVLLAGYAYAHFSSRLLRPRPQAFLHLLLLAAALAFLPITPGEVWKPGDSLHPVPRILALLAVNLGLPYFVLSSTGPLLQQWFSRAYPGRSPYRLYALSNAGSLLALLSYPFFFETHFTRKTQATLWACGLVAYAVFCGWCALKLFRGAAAPIRGNPQPTEQPQDNPVRSVRATFQASPTFQFSIFNFQFSSSLLWFLLPACASVLLLAITNKLCQDVAVIPFLWVLPLALYLLSFVICFDHPRWYARLPFALALIACSGAICWALFQGTDLSLYKQITIYSAALFVCCMMCHGELYRLKPAPEYLTSFYLAIAAGGALGGILVAVIAPLVFSGFYELHWGLVACGLLLLVVWMTENQHAPSSSGRTASSQIAPSSQSSWRWFACALTVLAVFGFDRLLAEFGSDTPGAQSVSTYVSRAVLWVAAVGLSVSWIVRGNFKSFQHWRIIACGWFSLGIVALAVTLWLQGREAGTEAIYRTRNFYGVLTIYDHERDKPKSHYLLLEHGRITHGLQFVAPDEARWPTSYYGEESGICCAFQALSPAPRKVGLVGLGTGTLTTYARTGDSFHIYEINPDVQRLARSPFTYLSNCLGQVEIALGDARLTLEREPSQHFDLLALDAFSSDAIPVHLLTKEAFSLYQRHLNPDGIIAVHVSNHYLDLVPVVLNLAREFNYRIVAIDYDEDEDRWWLYPSTWLLLSRNQQILNSPAIRDSAYSLKTNAVHIPIWTDDFASLFQILK
jgi:hypothetical protein